MLIKDYKSIRIFFFKKNTTNQAKTRFKRESQWHSTVVFEIQWYHQH
jgi:hypothetical protein